MFSYRQIVKSTALIGGTQVVGIILGVLRIKFVALLLGLSGVGAMGMYQSVTGFIGTLTGLGMRSAGVRQVAAAVGTNDDRTIGLTVRTLRRISLFSGLLGMLVVLAFCKPLGRATFDDNQHAWGIAIVSLSLLLGSVSNGEIAILQGMRRLRHLAACQILGALVGTAATILVVYRLGERGVPWSLVIMSAAVMVTSWMYVRRIRIAPPHITGAAMCAEARNLLMMGAAFVASGLMETGADYLRRIFIVRELGLDALGFYVAICTLSITYVNILLGAMGTDFLPRLTAVAGNHAAVNRQVNEQTVVSLLIALPGVLGTLVLAPWLLRVFYTGAFVPATEAIRWQTIGVALHVISWPLGYVQLAKGKPRLFVLTEAVLCFSHVGFLIPSLRLYGLDGVGIAYMATCLLYTLMILFVCRRMTGFFWTRNTLLLIGFYCVAILSVQFIVRKLPPLTASLIGLGIVVVVSVVCLWLLKILLHASIRQLLAGKLLRRYKS